MRLTDITFGTIFTYVMWFTMQNITLPPMVEGDPALSFTRLLFIIMFAMVYSIFMFAGLSLCLSALGLNWWLWKVEKAKKKRPPDAKENDD